MSDRLLLAFAILTLFSALGVVIQTHAQERVAVFYLDKPNCARPIALDLSSSLKTPFQSGVTVWLCE